MDQFNDAFVRVGLIADQVWWNNKDYSDDFMLASLGLWNEVIQSNERLSNSCSVQPNQPKVLVVEKRTVTRHHTLQKKKNNIMASTCRIEAQKKQQTTTTIPPQGVLSDTKCYHSANGPLYLKKTHPVSGSTSKEPYTMPVSSNKRVIRMGHMDRNTLPYSVDSLEELIYLRKLSSPAIKALWTNEGKRSSKVDMKGGVWEPGLDANVPEFYPSVLLPQQCPPSYSNIFGANYQSEVFPYNDVKPLAKDENETKSHKKKRFRGMSEHRNSFQYPGEDACDMKLLTEGKEKQPITDVNRWLQNIYSHRIMELSKLGTIARHLKAVSQQITNPFLQDSSSLAPCTSFTPTSERRLYRDVLARKIEEEEDKPKDDGEQNPFDELERQALEQYQSSETCLVAQTNSNDCITLDTKFQDLEREAMEQYNEDQDDVSCISLLNTNSLANKSEPLQSETLQGRFFLQKSDDHDLNSPLILSIDHSQSQVHEGPNFVKNNYLDDEKLVSEFIIGNNKTSRKIFSAQKMRCSEAETSLCGQFKSRQNNKKKKNKLSEDKMKYANKQLQEMKSASSSSLSYHGPILITTEDKIRHLATNLKHKVLNYLRSVDLKIMEETRKTNTKHQTKETIERPIQERVRVADIVDLETYRAYVREVSSKARITLLVNFKRVRSEIMELTSRGMVSFVCPSTSEKRKTRKIIRKCLELRNHADNMIKMPRNPLNSVKREVNEVLEAVHHTMQPVCIFTEREIPFCGVKVIYTLSNMTKEASDDVQYLENGKVLVADLYMGRVFLEDKSEYIKHQITQEERSVLMVVLFPRRTGILFHQDVANLKELDCVLNCDHDTLQLDYETQLRPSSFPAETSLSFGAGCLPTVKNTRVTKLFLFPRAPMACKDIWDSSNWIHVLRAGADTRRVSVELFPSARKAEMFSQVMITIKQSLPK